MIEDINYQNAHWFLTSKIVSAWTRLAAMDGHSESQRNNILAIPNAIALLPEFDCELCVSVEIDLYWEDKNWLGRLNYKTGELELWANMCQEEGTSRELCGQWQHTALRISSSNGLQKHDPAHLWYWAEHFALFVSACQTSQPAVRGSLVLASPAGEVRIYAGESYYREGEK
jgi:hypothetical protein